MKKDIKFLSEKYNLDINALKKQGYDLIVFRCNECAEELETYNPYVYDNGESIPIDKIKVVTTLNQEDCENHEGNMDSKPQRCPPIALYNMK